MYKRLLLLLILSFLTGSGIRAQNKEFLYVGTFSVRDGDGIFVYAFNRVKKTLTLVQKVKTLESPSYLEVHPSKKFLYAVNLGGITSKEPGGSVTAYSINPHNGKLTVLDSRTSYGADPCHISFDKAGSYAFVSNYGEGNLVVFPLFEDGLIGNPTDSKKYFGNSIHARQQSPHIHMAQTTPDNNFLIVTDLGTDKLYTYHFNTKSGRLTSTEQESMPVQPGCGPRHFDFNPNGKSVYVVEELTSTLAHLQYQPTTGTLTMIADTLATLKDSFEERNTSADIHVHPKGNFLYLTNRGANTIVTFTILPNGNLKYLSEQSTQGKNPRNFVMDKSGEFLFVANQDSDNIVIFRMNTKTGKLSLLPQQVKVKSPACLKLY